MTIFTDLPNWIKHCVYIAVICVVCFFVGKYSTPDKKIDIENTAEFKSAVEKSVAELRTSIESEWSKKVQTVYITKPDGTKIETKVVEDTGKKTQDKVEIKEVIKEVVTEKIVEKITIVENKANWALGVNVEPLKIFDTIPEWIVGVTLDRRLIGGLSATIGINTSISNFKPAYTLGLKIEF